MQHVKDFILLLIFTLLLTGCTGAAIESPTNTKLTIESYNVSDKEGELIRKTGVGQIEYFKLNGTLKEEDDLHFSIEVYENGKFKEEILKSWGAFETKYKNSLISFAVSENSTEEKSLKLLSGIPYGLTSTNYPSTMTGHAFSKLVTDKITLEKDKPKYLAGWLGTTKNRLRSIEEQNGEIPEAVKEYELAFFYKVLWTEKK